jgi:hypothetical protein
VARVARSYWGGDHSLFLGRVEYVRYGEGTPLLFHGGRYERVVRDPRVFAALPEELLRPLFAAGVERAYVDGEAIMRIGDPGDSLSLVLEGTVRVERPGRSLELTVATCSVRSRCSTAVRASPRSQRTGRCAACRSLATTCWQRSSPNRELRWR